MAAIRYFPGLFQILLSEMQINTILPISLSAESIFPTVREAKGRETFSWKSQRGVKLNTHVHLLLIYKNTNFCPHMCQCCYKA